ncbi:VPLPA-CTERM sorting domain-containing protein [Ruegeria lacuscaerulensis]|uniref:VPLPA-CTERM sorting domain-containing protein n=1 Tax=Ruegeria lacuscaerulensis TaxID=55218 RepID=UPI001F237166|nr:VPLPA-CTERM sorting domain-containing protein [Ruegeria lacuscaerulensis]
MRPFVYRVLAALLFLSGTITPAFALTQTWYVTGKFESSNSNKPALTGSFDYDPSQFTASNVALTANTGETKTNCCLISWDKVVFGWSGEAVYSPNDGRFYTSFFINQFDANNPTPATSTLALVFNGNPATSNKLDGVLNGQSSQGYCFISGGSCAGVNRTGGALFPHRDLISLSMSTTPPETVAPVPLPATGWLLLGGIGAFSIFRRNAKKARH